VSLGHIAPRLSRAALNPLQWVRYLLERWLVVPAARRLPVGVALCCADAVALLDLLLPVETRRAVLAEIAAATGRTGRAAQRLAWERLAAPRHELVYLTRMSAGRERLADWRVVQVNDAGVRALTDAGRSFVIAAGHFSSAALNVAQQVLPEPVAYVAGETATEVATPAELRRQLGDRSRDLGRLGLLTPHYPADTLWIRVPDHWGPDVHWDEASQRVATGRKMLGILRKPGGIVLVRIDAVWGAAFRYTRPFAGIQDRSFALGAARTARLAQCPLVPCVARIAAGGRQRTVVIEWGDPIPPLARTDEAGDNRILSRALDHLEAAIGRHPTEYLAHIGWERQWQRQAGTWEAL